MLELSTRQYLVRDFLLAMTTVSGDKDEKINAARYFADEIIADRATAAFNTVKHSAGAKTSTYAITKSGGTQVARREARDNLEGVFK